MKVLYVDLDKEFELIPTWCQENINDWKDKTVETSSLPSIGQVFTLPDMSRKHPTVTVEDIQKYNDGTNDYWIRCAF